MTAHEQVVCAYRETTPEGTRECVAPPDHDGGHYLRLLVRTVAEEEAS